MSEREHHTFLQNETNPSVALDAIRSSYGLEYGCLVTPDGQISAPRGVHEVLPLGWKFLTLWEGYGLSEMTWEPMSAFKQPDGTINPIFRSYLVENNESQRLSRAETLSQRKKKN